MYCSLVDFQNIQSFGILLLSDRFFTKNSTTYKFLNFAAFILKIFFLPFSCTYINCFNPIFCWPWLNLTVCSIYHLSFLCELLNNLIILCLFFQAEMYFCVPSRNTQIIIIRLHLLTFDLVLSKTNLFYDVHKYGFIMTHYIFG